MADRAAFGEFAQGLVVQDDIGRHTLFARGVGAPLAQALEQRGVGRRQVDQRDAAGFARCAAFLGRSTQLHRALPLEHFACRFGQLQGAVLGHVDMDQAGCGELAEDALPFALVEFAADAEGGQAVVAPLTHLVVGFAT